MNIQWERDLVERPFCQQLQKKLECWRRWLVRKLTALPSTMLALPDDEVENSARARASCCVPTGICPNCERWRLPPRMQVRCLYWRHCKPSTNARRQGGS
ncbi:MAG: hypothetical protein RKO24_07965 [Candidatus Competibacter sp.]|nr:hypothetical protein [Candidatus Competibacter sp.]